MKRSIFIVLLFVFSFSRSLGQYRESDNILQKLIWDDEKLSILIDTRVDFQGRVYDYTGDEWGFRAQTIKLWLAGEIVPGVRYRIRERLNKPQEPLREGYSAATDHAWIAIDIKKNWTITVGKQSVMLGTFEYDHNLADVYLSTMVNSDFDSYKTGVSFSYKFLGQALNLQIVNSDAPQFASDKNSKRALAMNLLWEGDLFGGVVKTRWAYGAFQHAGTKFYNWVTLGTQLNIGKFTLEVDYYGGIRNIDYGSVVDISDDFMRYVRDNSAALNFKYDCGIWKPSIKGVWGKRYDKIYGSTAYCDLGIEGALELYPFKEKLLKDLRFHVAYSYCATDFRGRFHSLGNRGVHTAIVGMRWLFKAK